MNTGSSPAKPFIPVDSGLNHTPWMQDYRKGGFFRSPHITCVKVGLRPFGYHFLQDKRGIGRILFNGRGLRGLDRSALLRKDHTFA